MKEGRRGFFKSFMGAGTAAGVLVSDRLTNNLSAQTEVPKVTSLREVRKAVEQRFANTHIGGLYSHAKTISFYSEPFEDESGVFQSLLEDFLDTLLDPSVAGRSYKHMCWIKTPRIKCVFEDESNGRSIAWMALSMW